MRDEWTNKKPLQMSKNIGGKIYYYFWNIYYHSALRQIAIIIKPRKYIYTLYIINDSSSAYPYNAMACICFLLTSACPLFANK